MARSSVFPVCSIFFFVSHIPILFSSAQWTSYNNGAPGGDGAHPQVYPDPYQYQQQHQPFVNGQLPPVIYPGGSMTTDFRQSQLSPNMNQPTSPNTFSPHSQTYPGGSLIPYPSNSKSISGDYCMEPLMSCDTTNTLLYCIKGRCTCPNQWTLAPLRTPLNTVWHPDLHRCVSTVGSGCQLAPTTRSLIIPPPTITSPTGYAGSSAYYPESPGTTITKEIASTLIKGLIGVPSSMSPRSPQANSFVYCQPGIKCRHSGRSETGICIASNIKINVAVLIASSLLCVFLNSR